MKTWETVRDEEAIKHVNEFDVEKCQTDPQFASYCYGFDAGRKDTLARMEKIREALELIVTPITCPACSLDGPSEGIPCYCFEDFSDPRHIAREALEIWKKEIE